MGLRVQLDEGAFAPERAHVTDAGFDLKTPKAFIVKAHNSAIIDTGVHVDIAPGYVGFLKSKSGLNVKHDITSEGVIDSGYDGSIVVKLYNHGDEEYRFEAGDKITQLVILRLADIPNIEIVDDIGHHERGDNGFGSTGR